MTIRIAPFDPHTASDELWAAFNETRRAIAHEFWPDEPILDDAETRREVQTNNPMVEFRRWVAMEGDEVSGLYYNRVPPTRHTGRDRMHYHPPMNPTRPESPDSPHYAKRF